MMHVSPNQIREALATGKDVISATVGRFGQVVSVDDLGWAKVCYRRRKNGGLYGVTRFDGGDEVELVTVGDRYVIRNVATATEVAAHA